MEERIRLKLAEFLRTERSKLIRYVRYLIDDASDRDGEDIIQDVMLNIFNLADISIPIDNLAAYIYRSLKNRVIDIFKKKKYESISFHEKYNENSLSLKDILHDYRYDTAKELEKKEVRDIIFSAIDSLDKEYKEIFILTEFGGKSFKEISEEFKIPIGTLLSRKSRAIKKIKEMLNHYLKNGYISLA